MLCSPVRYCKKNYAFSLVSDAALMIIIICQKFTCLSVMLSVHNQIDYRSGHGRPFQKFNMVRLNNCLALTIKNKLLRLYLN
ncbi:hypothetical protein BpHYR1_011596 [Brachionus plicatilis]|uniref:Uncharacterized protein n=1 Tax=Brachionus plicatilis TaxID=10195 RepID=A0A3M7S347_BRAPC|nr:hypothetical protein BpHYR1_011596 [Brachionus plicatilis]